MAKIIDAVIQLADKFTPTLHKVEGALTEHEKVQKRTAKNIQNTGSSIMGVGLKISALVAPMAAAATEGLKLNSQFSAGMSKIATLLGNDIEAANRLKQGLRDLSDETGVSVTDLTEAEYQAISAGVDAAHVTEFMGTATKLSQAGFADASTTIDALTSVLNAYGLSADNAAHIADEFILTQNLGKTTVAEMAATIGGVIPIASAAGVSTEELMASVAALTKNGMKTPDAMTALKGAISGIIKPSEAAMKQLQEMGLSIDTLSAKHLNEVGLTGVLNEIKTATNGDTDAMAKLFPNVRALNAMLALTGPAGSTYTQALNEMKSANGLTEQTFQQLLKNDPTKATALAINQLKNAGMDLGQGLAPILLRASMMTKRLAKALKELSPEQWKMITGFVQTSIVLGVGLTAVGKAVKMFGTFQMFLAGAGKHVATLNKGIGFLGGVFGAFGPKVGQTEKEFNSFQKGAQSAQKAIATLTAPLRSAGTAIISVFSRAGAGVTRFVASCRSIGPVMTIARAAIAPLNPLITRAILLFQNFGASWRTPAQLIRSGITSIVSAFRMLGTAVLHPIASFRRLFTAIRAGFTLMRVLMASNPIGIALLALTVIIGFVITHWNTFKQAFTTSFQKIAAVVGPVVANISARFSRLAHALQTVAARAIAAWNQITGQTQTSGSVISTIINTVASVFTAAGIIIVTAIETAFNIVATVLEGFLTVADGVITFVTGVFTGNWSQAWEGVKKIFTGIFDTIKGVFDDFCSGIMNALDRIIGKSGEAKQAANDAQSASESGGSGGGEEPARDWIGSNFFQGGLTWINEMGPELVNLPTGTQIVPHDESMKQMFDSGIAQGLQTAMGQAQSLALHLQDFFETEMTNMPSLPELPSISTGPKEKGAVSEPVVQVTLPRERNRQQASAPSSAPSAQPPSVNIQIGSLAETMIVREEADIDRIARKLYFMLKSTAINRM